MIGYKTLTSDNSMALARGSRFRAVRRAPQRGVISDSIYMNRSTRAINRGFDDRGDRHYHNPTGVAEYDGKERAAGGSGVASESPMATAAQEGRDRTRPIKFSIVCRGKWDFGAGRN